MLIDHNRLRGIVQEIFAAAGCQAREAQCVADHLVEANLVGHDSHGVIRVPVYIQWLQEGKLAANQSPLVVLDEGPHALVDGRYGLGQVMGQKVMHLAIDKASKHGVGLVGLRKSGHVGRVGHWATMAANAGFIGLCFVNTSGRGILVAPFGGIDRRLSANPLAVGIPIAGAEPIILDISTCSIAEGKIRVALNQGNVVPDGCIIDAEGQPTNEPTVFYADPPGAILPVGGHKGFGLGLIVDILAGALTGGGCTREGVDRLEQGMFTIVLDPEKFQPRKAFGTDISRFIDFVKSSRTVAADGEILIPGEPERRTKTRRLADGIELDDKTWSQLVATGQSIGLQSSRFDDIRNEQKPD